MSGIKPTIFLLAGEPSGDRLGADLMDALHQQQQFTPLGVGGPLMIERGLTSLYPMSDLSVMGFSDVIRRLPLLLWRVRQTARAIMAAQPQISVLIDAQVFNYLVARQLRKAGYTGRVLLYVAPSVWAWKPERALKLRPLFDEVMAVLPMEPEVMDRLGGPPTSYVGHPALKVSPEVQRRSQTGGLLALLPGSRVGEIRRHLPLIRALAERLKGHPRVTGYVLPTLPWLVDRLRAETAHWNVDVAVVAESRERNAALARTSAAVVTAGTVTLELALAGIPMVGTYVPDKRLMHHYKKAGRPMIALPNIILQRQVVPEIAPGDEMLDNLSAETTRILDSAVAQDRQLAAFAQLRRLMNDGAPGAPRQNPANRVLAYL